MSESIESMFTFSTGIKTLDAKIGGFTAGDIYAICGRPVMGKTSLCLSICSQIAFNGKVPTALFSLELSMKHVIKRLSLIHGEIDKRNVVMFEWLPEKTTSFKMPKFSKDLEKPLLIIDDDPLIELDSMSMKITRLVHLYGIRFIFIDYLELLSYDKATTLINLKKLAKNLNIVIVIFSIVESTGKCKIKQFV